VLASDKQAFAFSGCVPLAGGPYRELAAAEPLFHDVLRKCDAILRKEVDAPLFEILWNATPAACVTNLEYNFPLVVALQIAHFELLRHYGIDAEATVGMSCGEVASAYAAGLIGMEDALRIAAHGARLMAPQANQFRMALVWADAATCADAIRHYSGRLAIAAYMEPGVVAVSGERIALDALLHQLPVRTLRFPFAWGAHTSLLTDGRDEFERLFRGLPSLPRTRQILSTSLGEWQGTDFRAGHWWPMFSRPVLFQPSVRRMIDEGIGSFVEVGPSSALAELIPRIGGTVTSFASALGAGREQAMGSFL